MATVLPSPAEPGLETQVFWERYKMEIIAALVVAIVAIAGVTAYRIYNNQRQSSAASALAEAKGAPDFQKVIADFPKTGASGTAAILLAEDQRANGKFAEANATLQAFIERSPKHDLVGTARMAMAANLESLGKNDEALTTYQRLAAEDPHAFTAPLAMLSQIHLLKQKHQTDDARRVCEAIINQYHDSIAASEATRELRSLKAPAEVAVKPTAATSPQPSAAPVKMAPQASASPKY